MNTDPLQGLAEGEKIRKSIQHIQMRLESAVEGYASWFDQRVVDEAILKKVAETDASLVGWWIDSIKPFKPNLKAQSMSLSSNRSCIN